MTDNSLSARQVTTEQEINFLLDHAQFGDEHKVHCIPGQYPERDDFVYYTTEAADRRVIAVYKGDTPLAFVVVNRADAHGEWIVFCADPGECFPDAVRVLIESVVEVIGDYWGRVENPGLLTLFDSIDDVVVEGNEVKRLWKP